MGSASKLAAADSSQPAPQPPDAWRIKFAQDRYAKLLELLGAQVGAEASSRLLQSLGGYCASGLPHLARHPGDLEGFIKDFAEAGDKITYDPEKKTVLIEGSPREECFCPLIDKHKAPKTVCDCSLGWQRHIYQTLLGRKVNVELVESVVRGGKRCVFKVQITDEKLPAA
ncbi:hypothetical protein DB347_20115 [Opitutaceae bacterium EW11]|nr:hypothetical protein DB347_20115 [Opitutaceae bacterium EW11]